MQKLIIAATGFVYLPVELQRRRSMVIYARFSTFALKRHDPNILVLIVAACDRLLKNGWV